MGQVNVDGRSTLGLSSAQEKAARVTMLVLDGARIPSMERTKWRRRRDRHAEPSPLARAYAYVDECFAMGISRDRAQMLVDDFQRHLDRVYGDPARVTDADVAREMLAEHAENMAALPFVRGDRSPNACREWADAMRRENALQSALIVALEAEAEGAR